jgi:hypothetical protein
MPVLDAEQVGEVARRQRDHVGHAVAVDVLLVVLQHVAAGVLGAVVLDLDRRDHDLAVLAAVLQDHLGQFALPQRHVGGQRGRRGLEGRAEGLRAGRGVGGGRGAAGDRGALQELQDVLGRLLDVGALGHQDGRVVAVLEQLERGLEVGRDLGGVDEDQAGALGPLGGLPAGDRVQQDLGPEEGETQFRRALLARVAQKDDLLQGVHFAPALPGIGRKLNNEAVPCSFDRFQSGFHDCPPHT